MTSRAMHQGNARSCPVAATVWRMIRTSMNALIHGAFRRDLGRFAAALDEADDDHQARLTGLKLAWRNFHRQLVEHHEGEHTTAWPALVSLGVDASVLAEMDGEHDVMAARLSVADTAFEALGSPGSTESARSALTALRAVTEQHFDHEVAVLEPVYLREADSAPIKAMERTFLRHQTPRGAGSFSLGSRTAGQRRTWQRCATRFPARS